MKIYLVILALVVFTGAPASVLSEQPVSKLELLRQDFTTYFENITRLLEEEHELLRQAVVLQELKEHTAEGYANLSQRFDKLVHELPSEVKDSLERVVRVTAGAAQELFKATRSFFERLRPANRDLYQALEPVLAPHAKQVRENMRPYTDAVRDRIQLMTQKRVEQLKSDLQELEDLGPQVQEALEQMREVRAAILPWLDNAQDLVMQKMEAAVDTARPYVRPVLDAAGLQFHKKP